MSDQSHTQKNQHQNNRSFRCPRCKLILPNRIIFQEHLRNHVSAEKHDSTHLKSTTTSQADETARYIAERRKNFPTTDNIIKKIKSDEERQERGDVLETRQFGRMKEPKKVLVRPIESELLTTSINSANKPPAEKATLLERLLANDIRRERNMVLQCIRHIVNNDFYGLDHK